MHRDHERGLYRAVVRDPRGKWRGTAGVARPVRDREDESEMYDALARHMIQRAERDQKRKLPAERDKDERVQIRRVFQAPCPYGPWEE
jgi:hypothetical protein